MLVILPEFGDDFNLTDQVSVEFLELLGADPFVWLEKPARQWMLRAENWSPDEVTLPGFLDVGQV